VSPQPTDWKRALADALDHQALALRHALDALTEVEEILEGRSERDSTEIRGTAALIRSQLAAIQAEARELRTNPPDQRDGFPLALTNGPTTRTVRRPP
jgi:hypothetical protein